MDTTPRTIAKSLCWQVCGLIVMTLLGYLFTGSLQSGGALAVLSCLIGFLTFILHEKLWSQVSWGRR